MPEKQRWKCAISRRRALALVGAGGLGTIAGCLGDDDEGSNGNGGDEDALDEYYGEDPEDVEHEFDADYEDWSEVVVPGSDTPYDGVYIFNPYHTSWGAGDHQELGYEYLSVYHTEEGEFIPRVAEDWEIDEDTLETEVTISDEYGWSNGDPITAHDFETSMRLDAYMELGLETYVDPDEGITAEDDQTLLIQPREEYADLEFQLWENQFAEWVLTVSDAHYGGFVEQFEDASDDDEVADIQGDVTSYDPHWDQTMFSGPLVYVEANEEFADQTPNPNHPATDDWEFYFRHGQTEEEEGLRAGQVTFVHQEPTLQDLPDIYEEPPVSYSGQTFALLFGPEDEYIYEYPEVRQALAFAIDHQTIVDNAYPATPVDTYSAGIDVGYIEQFVEEDALEAMTDYSVHDEERAQELLEDVGFSHDDGTWYTPDDEVWELNFPHGDWFEDHGEMINNNLAEFGVESSRYSDDMGTWEAEHGDTLDYDISAHLNYGMARDYHALSDFEEELFDADRAVIAEMGMLDEEEEIPEVGDPEGDTFTLNFREALNDMAVAGSEEEVMEIATEVAWAHNQLLPAAMIHSWSEQYWVDTENWDFDVESDDWLTSNRIGHYLIENGLEAQ